MSLSPLVSFKSRFVTYLLNFPRMFKKVMFFVTGLHVICIHRTHTGKVICVGHSVSAYLSLVTTGSLRWNLILTFCQGRIFQIVYFMVWNLRLSQVCRWRF